MLDSLVIAGNGSEKFGLSPSITAWADAKAKRILLVAGVHVVIRESPLIGSSSRLDKCDPLSAVGRFDELPNGFTNLGWIRNDDGSSVP